MNNIPPFYNSVMAFIKQGSLVTQILIAIIAGGLLATVSPAAASSAGLMGELFVGALKAVAPVLVLVLVTASLANHSRGQHSQLRPIITLYLLGTIAAALTAVAMSFLFPTTLVLVNAATAANPPQGIGEVLHNLAFKIVANPISAIMNGNYIAILAWAIALGVSLQQAGDSTKHFLSDMATAVTAIVGFVIRLAPLGIFGLMASTIAETGFSALISYSHLLSVLIATMLFIALVVNPLLVFYKIRRNPYPLVFKCLRESGVTAFFTRSSAANIPVNMDLAKRLKLDKDSYSVAIPLGATINMAGAAITITVLSLAAVNTLGLEVDFVTALLLSIIAAVSACGASGVAGGSLLLIPLACSLFGISNDIAMQVVAVGFIIGVLQDSAETALNSSTDILFTTACCQAAEQPSSPVL